MNIEGFPSDERRRRAEAWVAAWRTTQASTERVDRHRAERALTALYRERGLHAPGFLWAHHATDAVTAWHLVAREREPLRNPFTNGDWGNGYNRDLYRLQDPFGLDPAWTGRALRRAAKLAPSRRPWEPLVMVEVRDSTPEPDGLVRIYFPRVPPTMRSARAAVAWTFGLHGSAYEPAVEA